MQTWKPINFLSYHPRLCSLDKWHSYNLAIINCSSIYQCNRDFDASTHWSGHSSEQDPEFEHGYSTNKKRLFGSRSPKARQLSAPAALTSSSNNFPLFSLIVPFAMCYPLALKALVQLSQICVLQHDLISSNLVGINVVQRPQVLLH